MQSIRFVDANISVLTFTIFSGIWRHSDGKTGGVIWKDWSHTWILIINFSTVYYQTNRFTASHHEPKKYTSRPRIKLPSSKTSMKCYVDRDQINWATLRIKTHFYVLLRLAHSRHIVMTNTVLSSYSTTLKLRPSFYFITLYIWYVSPESLKKLLYYSNAHFMLYYGVFWKNYWM